MHPHDLFQAILSQIQLIAHANANAADGAQRVARGISGRDLAEQVAIGSAVVLYRSADVGADPEGIIAGVVSDAIAKGGAGVITLAGESESRHAVERVQFIDSDRMGVVLLGPQDLSAVVPGELIHEQLRPAD